MTHHRNYKHGGGNTRLYGIWHGMRRRCFETTHKDFPFYGGRGISICKEWSEFVPFRDWAMTNGYTDDLTIDRINTWGDYEPNNCQWIPHLSNSRKDYDYYKHCKPVNQILDNKIIATYPSAIEAERQTNIDAVGICQVCKKRLYRKTAGGFKWEYSEVK